MTQEEIIRTLAETESRSKSNTHRMDAVEKDQKAISQLASSVAVMANEQAHMRGDPAMEKRCGQGADGAGWRAGILGAGKARNLLRRSKK